LIKGVDKSIKDKTGKTPADLAIKNNQTKILELLE